MEQKYVKEAFDTNWVVPLGPNVDGFEKALEEFIGENKRIVALASGTAAVHLALVEWRESWRRGDCPIVHLLRLITPYHIFRRHSCFCGFGARHLEYGPRFA